MVRAELSINFCVYKMPLGCTSCSPMVGSTPTTSALNTLPGMAGKISSASSPALRRSREFWRKAATYMRSCWCTNVISGRSGKVLVIMPSFKKFCVI